MARRSVGRKYLTKEDALKFFETISDDNSGSDIEPDEKFNIETISRLSDEDWIVPSGTSEYDSSDEDSFQETPNENDNLDPENIPLPAASTDSRNEISGNSQDQEGSQDPPNRTRKQLRRTQCEENKNDEETANDGSIWKIGNISTNVTGRRPHQNVLREVSGPTSHAKRKIVDGSASSAWRLFFNEKILRHIQQCTEEEARKKSQNPNWSLSLNELDAFISLLYARGALAAKGLPILSLWSKSWGPKFFAETMSRDRFLEIMKYLRFDMKSTRSERLQTDPFAHISYIWNTFIENCLMNYKPGENIVVDEQLFPMKTRCRFIQYMPKKPDKFGIKFWLATDVHSKYLLNGFPYLGKDETRPYGRTVGEHAAFRLIEPYYNTGRNLTTDNFFTSLNLVKQMRDAGISCVGTINRSKREVPNSFKKTRDVLYSSKIAKHENITLTSYQGKKNKNVLLLSSLHPTLEISSNEKQKPEVVNFYNATKYGVDVLDQMARKYSVKSSSRRWPVQVFFNILDFAAINAWIIYKETTGNNNYSRRDFILDTAEELRKMYVSSKKPTLSSSNQLRIDACPTPSRKRKQCQINTCKGNKTQNICENCRKYVCGTCTSKIKKSVICVYCQTE